MVLAQPRGQAQTTEVCLPTETANECIPFSRGFLIPGDYAVAGIDLTHQNNPSQNGFSTGEIEMSGVPYDADILAAYLYWETIHVTATPAQANGVQFRGQPIDFADVEAVKRSKRELSGSTAACFSSGTPLTMSMFRADVLRFLPIRKDTNNKPTGKHLVNTADLVAHGETGLTVRLPVTSGNQLPESAGASLLVIYRSPDPNAALRSIVVYDGIWVQPSTAIAMERTIEGFYKAPATADARLTHITGSGQPNGNERILFDGPGPFVDPVTQSPNVVVAQKPPDPDEPFFGGTASQRAWATKEVPIPEALMDSAATITAETVGEQAKTIVDHVNGGAYDCLSWGAVIFSTKVLDEDGDGLPDAVEDTAGGLVDPTGAPLDDFNAMGASSSHPDIFIEVNAHWADANVTYGGAAGAAHNHLPTPEVLAMVGQAYLAQGIHAHFDVGDIDATGPGTYRGLGIIQHSDWVDDYTSTAADAFLIPTIHARGGEIAKERPPCQSPDDCQFKAWPGTVSWKLGLQLVRDAPVGDLGEELQPDQFDNWEAGNCSGQVDCDTHRRRFDRVRRGLFHYLLYAHARGRPKSPFPCLVNGDPAPYPANQTSCPANQNNPDYRIPSSASGIADQPGGNAMVTLGLWDDFVGRPFVRASTTLHELGHNLNLWHGGLPAVWGDKAPPSPMVASATYIEPNCKPNYLSSMSYLYQSHGLFEDDDSIHLNYSTQSHPPGTNASINETTLTDGAFTPTPTYRPAWFAPADSALADTQDVLAATRFCSGAKFFSTTLNGAIAAGDESLTLTNASGASPPPAPFHVVITDPPASPQCPVPGATEIVLVGASCAGNVCSSLTRGTQGTAAANHCNGAKVAVTYVPGMARVLADTTTTPIDWDGDADAAESGVSQDVNYDNNPAPYGTPTPAGQTHALLFGVRDWDNDPATQDIVRLNQIGAGRNYTLISNASGDLALAEGDLALAEGDLALAEGDLALAEGDLAVAEGDIANAEGDLAVIEGDLAQAEGDLLVAEGLEAPQTLEVARGLGRTAPHDLTTCVIGVGDCRTTVGGFTPLFHRTEIRFFPTTVDPAVYVGQRKVTGTNDSTYVDIALVQCPGPPTEDDPKVCAIDPSENPDGVHFTYRLKATFDQAPFESGWSLPAPEPPLFVLAVNAAPSAAADTGYQTFQSTAKTFDAPGVLGNDMDQDSPPCDDCALNPTASFRARRAQLLTTAHVPVTPNPDGSYTTATAQGGTVQLWPDGKFTFTPRTGFTGPDWFFYRSDDGAWHLDPGTPLSGWSGPAQATVDVLKLKKK